MLSKGFSTTRNYQVSPANEIVEFRLKFELLGCWTDIIAEAVTFVPLSNFTQSDVTGNLSSTINCGTAQYLPQDSNQILKANTRNKYSKSENALT